MLNVSCLSNDDCLLKNSICDQLTKRCECDYGTIQGNSRCKLYRLIQFHHFNLILGEIMVCTSSEECLTRFPNTICMFGRCQCRYGLKANGQCVQLEGLLHTHNNVILGRKLMISNGNFSGIHQTFA